MNYKHLFFDLDRTLWDFETNSFQTLNELYEKHQLKAKGIECKESFIKTYQQINIALWDDFSLGKVSKEDIRRFRFKRALELHGVHDEELSNAIGEDYIYESPRRICLFPYAIETLEYLCKKYTLHILTNGFEQSQHFKLKTSNMQKYFNEVITSERSGFSKPNPKMFEYALSSAGATKEESLMIGDHWEGDIIGAKKYGIHQVYFNPLKASCNSKPTFEISCLSELRSFL